tara:strand:+ start:5012 stop:5539 length:528 start_codon:yes stop_codon:yes gene_type:complete
MLGFGDPRAVGSKNPGATNVLREFGKIAAGLTLFGDIIKGFIPVAVCISLGFDQLSIALAGVGAFVGHLFPVFFRFTGGKGVATLIGILLGFDVWLGVAFIACWIAIASATRYSSLAALIATVLAPILAQLFNLPTAIVVATSGMGVLIFWRHRSNIRNLLANTEDKIGGSGLDT